MKKIIVSSLLILVGCVLWLILAGSARFQIKKWDAKFETVTRYVLNESGISAKDLLSSVHEIQKDNDGEWVVHRVSVRMPDSHAIDDLRKALEKAQAKRPSFRHCGKTGRGCPKRPILY